jgi:hypothetical protein
MSTLIERCYYIVLPLPEKVLQGQRAAIPTGKAMTTIDVIGLPEVKRLLPMYESAPKEHDLFGLYQKKAIKTKNTWLIEIMNKLKQRKSALELLVSRMDKMETEANLPQVRYELVTEIAYATQQVFFSPSKESKDWLRTLGGYLKRLERRERTVQGDMAAQISRDEKTLKANLAKNPDLKLTYSVD